MAYPGDSSLTREIQIRIISTFLQALELSDENRRDEADLSCDFILRLDAQFEPARALKRRLAEAEVLDLDDLREIATAASDEEAAVESAIEGLTSFDDAEAEPAGAPEIPAPTATAEDVDELAVGDDLLSLDLGVGGDSAEESGEATIPAPETTVETGPELSPIDLSEAPETDSHEDFPLEDRPAEVESPEDGFDLEMSRALSHLGPFGAEQADDAEARPAKQPAATGSSTSPARAEADERIVELLQEGQAGFDQKKYQQAIDAWSRIFLIDIDHTEANNLIEKARQLKAEAERELDEVLHDGIAQMEAGENQLARDAFERILALQPNHLVAKEYLEELQEGSLGLDPAVAEAGVSLGSPEPFAAAGPDTKSDTDVQPRAADKRPARKAAPVDQERERPKRTPAKKPVRATIGKNRQSFLMIGSAVLILALAGGWYLIGNWQGIFPNSATDSAESAGRSKTGPFQQARKLQAAGKTEAAVKLLEKLPSNDANYDAAQALIAQFKAAEEASREPIEEGLSSETIALLQNLEGQARQAMRDRRYLKTDMILNRIAEIQPLTADQAAMSDEVASRLEPIKAQVALIRQGEWESALPQLWRLLENQHDNQDILQLLVTGYFNLGIRDLQRGKPKDAILKFQEALILTPNDEEVARLIAFSKTYEQRYQDLRYRIFVKYVPFR